MHFIILKCDKKYSKVFGLQKCHLTRAPWTGTIFNWSKKRWKEFIVWPIQYGMTDDSDHDRSPN